MDVNSIEQIVINTYIDRIHELPLEKGRHFLHRAWLASKRRDLRKRLESEFRTFSEQRYLNYLSDFKNGFKESLKNETNNIHNLPVRKINEEKRNEQWLKHIELKVFSHLLTELYYYTFYNPGYREKSIDAKKYLLELLKSEDYCKYATVSACDIVYYSKNKLGLDFEEDFIALFRKIFLQSIENQELFFNYIYGLTHIIIGATDFYLKGIKKQSYSWVLQELNKYQNRIYDDLTLDINVEVALCYKILGVKSEFVGKVVNRAMRGFNKRIGYIKREGESSFEFAEHQNAVSLLLID